LVHHLHSDNDLVGGWLGGESEDQHFSSISSIREKRLPSTLDTRALYTSLTMSGVDMVAKTGGSRLME